MAISLVLFFVGILSDLTYYHECYPHNIKDVMVSAALVVLGAFIMFTFMDTDRGILYGAFVAVLGNLMILSYRLIKYRPKTGDGSAAEE